MTGVNEKLFMCQMFMCLFWPLLSPPMHPPNPSMSRTKKSGFQQRAFVAEYSVTSNKTKNTKGSGPSSANTIRLLRLHTAVYSERT